MTRDLPVMLELRCPDCARSGNAAVLILVPASIGSYTLITFEQRKQGDRLYLCDLCVVCRTRWCIKLLPDEAESPSLAA